MKVEQVAQLANDIVKESVGEEALMKEDLSNVVIHGKAVADVMGVENYTRELIDRIGRLIVVDRLYEPPLKESVMRDDWEYGSIAQKISYEPNKATQNEAWMLQDGQVYEENKFNKPEVNAKFFNGLNTFNIETSRPDYQAKSAFINRENYMRFLGGLDTQVQNDMAMKIDELSKRIINNMIGETFYNLDSDGTYTGKTGNRAINVLYLYNQAKGKSLTSLEDLMNDPEALRYTAFLMDTYKGYLREMSTLYNMGGKYRFTPESKLHTVMLSQFRSAADMFSQSDTFHDELLGMPLFTEVAYWQGNKGESSSNDFATNSSIAVVPSSEDGELSPTEVEQSGIVCVLADRQAVAVGINKRRSGNFYNSIDAYSNISQTATIQYINDLTENGLVFVVANGNACLIRHCINVQRQYGYFNLELYNILGS